jgi:uncharacterized protein (DUF4415 family)
MAYGAIKDLNNGDRIGDARVVALLAPRARSKAEVTQVRLGAWPLPQLGEHFRAGAGWQTCIDSVLSQFVAQRSVPR